jgi:hypothetical protein
MLLTVEIHLLVKGRLARDGIEKHKLRLHDSKYEKNVFTLTV